MITQLDTRIISSFLLYVDHELQRAGQAYRTVTGRFFPATSPYSGRYIYTAPERGLCNDVSITGCQVLSGVYLGNQFVTLGQSGLTGINHYKGAVTFSSPLPSGVHPTGTYSVKEINVKLTDKTDWKLMFETDYVASTNIPYPATGVPLDAEVAPMLFVRVKSQENKPFGFARLDNQSISLRCILIADNEFQKIGATTILKNFNYRTVQIVQSVPFDALGNFTGGSPYDYNAAPKDTSFTPIIFGVKAIDVPQEGQFKDIRRNMAIVDLEISTIGRT